MDESKSVSRKKEEDEAELLVRIGRNKRRRRWEFISVRFYFQSATLRTTHDGIGFGGPHLVPPPASAPKGTDESVFVFSRRAECLNLEHFPVYK